MIFAIIFIAVLLFLGLLLFVPMRIGIEYELKDKKQNIKLILYISKIPIKIPIMTDNEEKKSKKKVKRSTEQPPEHKGYDEFKRSVSNFAESYRETKEKLKDTLRYLRKHTTCSDFHFTIHFGLSDAAKTGIMTGATWTTGTLLLRVIDQMIGIKHIKMNVYPDFNKQRFDVHIKCILRVQTVHIINVGIQLSKLLNVFTSKKESS